MRKIIFELGLLAFCVAAVVFVLQGFDLFDTIGRAFIVFVGVELAGALGLAATAWIAAGAKRPEPPAAAQDVHREQTPAGTYQQPAAQTKGGAA